jgi:hypothetical protein
MDITKHTPTPWQIVEDGITGDRAADLFMLMEMRRGSHTVVGLPDGLGSHLMVCIIPDGYHAP